MIFHINIQEPYLGFVLNGIKTVEGRLNKGKFLDIKIGDILNINDKAEFVVVDKSVFSSFREMITKEGLKNVIPDVESIDEAVKVYYRFYTEEDEKKYGVVGIKIVKK